MLFIFVNKNLNKVIIAGGGEPQFSASSTESSNAGFLIPPPCVNYHFQ